jgi:GcrA cell cycle regulator
VHTLTDFVRATSSASTISKTVSTSRKHWSQADIAAAVAALSSGRTAEIAKQLNVNPKALRSALRRAGVSLRVVREAHHRETAKPSLGVSIRRSLDAPLAIHGADALAALPTGACHWPHGDPSEPDFAFCGAPRTDGSAYCALHRKRSKQPQTTLEASPHLRPR